MEDPGIDGDYEVRMVREEDWPHIEPLWHSFYEHQIAHGMLLELPPDAYQSWVASMRTVLGRFAFVFVVQEGEDLVGFFAGRIRSLPSYFGGHQVGFFSDLFVIDSHRRRGVADILFSTGTSWFRDQGIDRLELHVVSNNTEAREFFRRRGMIEELTLMVSTGKDAGAG